MSLSRDAIARYPGYFWHTTSRDISQDITRYLRQLSCGYIADNIVDDFVENVVINIVILLELFSAECSWQKAKEFGLIKGLVGPRNKYRNKYRG